MRKEIVPLKRKKVVLLTAYDKEWRRLLWQAFRSERQQFPTDGREVFASHVEDIITRSLPKLEVETTDGKKYEGHKYFPTAETYSNFLKNGLSPAAGRISGRTSTLQIIHLYLWLRRPESVAAWQSNRSNRELCEFVDGADKNFRTYDPQSIFPVATRIFKMQQCQPMRNSARLERFYHATEVKKLDEQSKRARAFLKGQNSESSSNFEFWGIIFPVESAGTTRGTLFFSAEEWEWLEATFYDDVSAAKFNFINNREAEDSIVIEDRSIDLREGFEKPKIPKNRGHWVIRMNDILTGEKLFAKIGPINLGQLPAPLWENNADKGNQPNWVYRTKDDFDHFCQTSAAAVFPPDAEEKPVLLPAPILESDLNILNLLTGRSQ